MDHKNFIAFSEQYGDDVVTDILNRIDNLAWSRRPKDPVVSISNTHQHNATNHTHTGFVEYDGKTYAFEYDSGDWNGSVMRQWGDPETVPAFEPPKPPYPDFVPRDPSLPIFSPFKYGVYLAWRNEPWFEEKRRGYAYDRHFQPGSLTESHYRKIVEGRGLAIIFRDEAPVRPTGRTCIPADPSITATYRLAWQYFTDDTTLYHDWEWNAEQRGWMVWGNRWRPEPFANIGWYLPE